MTYQVQIEEVNTYKPTHFHFEFKGTGTEFFKIWLVNILLSIITLGIYSAWAKVRTQRYFYGHTQLNDASFEYLATPWQILKGRIIAVILFVAYSFLSSLHPFIGLALFLLLFAAMPFIVVLALRFQHKVSVYKNIHFQFQGSVKEAAVVYLLWPLLSTLTLGLLYPFFHQRMAQFYVTNSLYGNVPFKNEAQVADFYKWYLLLFASLFALVAGLVYLISTLFPGQLSALTDHPADSTALLIMASFYLIFFLFYFLYFAFVKSVITNLIVNSTSLDNYLFLRSNLSFRSMLFILLTNALAIVCSLGLAYPWAKVRLAKYRAEHTAVQASGSIDNFIGSHVDTTSSAFGDEASEIFDIDIGL